MSRADKQFRLNELQKIIPALENDTKRLKQAASESASNLGKLRNEQANIVASLTAAKKEITVSDHALVRYLERRHGFDFEQYREEILTPLAKQAIQAGATSIKVGDISFKVGNNTIVTAI